MDIWGYFLSPVPGTRSVNVEATRPDRERIAEIAARRPGRTAVQASDGTLTYAELERKSNQLARRLIALGVTRDACVGISLPRGAGELVAMLATLKAGGAYVPLDPTTPTRPAPADPRGRPPTGPGGEGRLAVRRTPLGREPLVFDDLSQSEQGRHASNVPSDPMQLAYVSFTSGSTGRPKEMEIPAARSPTFLRSWRTPGRPRTIGCWRHHHLIDIAGLKLLPLWVGATVVIATNTRAHPRRLAITSPQRHHRSAGHPSTWRMMAQWWLAGMTVASPLRRRGVEPGAGQRLVGCGRLWNMDAIRNDRLVVVGAGRRGRRSDYHRQTDRRNSDPRSR